MQITLKTAFYCIQSLLRELKDLEDNINSTNGKLSEEDIEDMRVLEHIAIALEELQKVYTDYIEQNAIINYPTFEKMKKDIFNG